MTPKVTISTAVYNAEKLLPVCIESVLAQTFKDFELLLINDGSSDRSGEICDNYACQDNRIKVIHQHNKGLSNVRNKAISEAQGQFICFVDNDDSIEPDMVEIMLGHMQANSAQIVMCKYKTVHAAKTILKVPKISNEFEILNSSQAIQRTYQHTLAGFGLFNKMFSISIFNKVTFPEGRDFQDAAVLYKLLHNAEKIVFSHQALYNYCVHEQSTTSIINSTFNRKRMQIVQNYEESYSFMKHNYPNLLQLITAEYFESLRSVIIDYMKENTRNKDLVFEIQDAMISLLPHLKGNKLISNSQKAFAASFSKFPFSSLKVYWLIVAGRNNLQKVKRISTNMEGLT